MAEVETEVVENEDAHVGSHPRYGRGCRCQSCRDAHSAYNTQWEKGKRKNDPEALHAREALHRASHREELAKYNREWRVPRLEHYAELTRAWAKENPTARYATGVVYRAIRSGRLEKSPCELCGSPAEAHHEDYSKPLDVTWLCRSHHRQLHSNLRSLNV